jgi:hypothetical protein
MEHPGEVKHESSENPKATFQPRRGPADWSNVLRVGMQVESLGAVLGQEPCVRMVLMDPEQPFLYFPYLGVALRVGADKNVAEIVLAQVPISR